MFDNFLTDNESRESWNGGPSGGFFDASRSSSAKKVYNVTELLGLAKGTLESITATVIGEVSEVSANQGYKAVYFSIKDGSSVLKCMMWNSRYNTCGIKITVGALVELTGRLSIYMQKGVMQFDVTSLSLAGEGKLRMQVAQLAKKLDAEGLMSAARKMPIPAYPTVIGLVTSPRGDAVHDVLRTLRRRFPLARVVFYGVPVEGVQAPAYLCKALNCIVAAGPEVVLLVRGGGSYEDLMPFNDEQLARTIAALPVPVVTGIGHEPDTTIADLVADLRASTPTAAAEAVSTDVSEIYASFAQKEKVLNRVIVTQLNGCAQQLQAIGSRPLFTQPQTMFSQDAQTLDILNDHLQKALPQLIETNATSLTHYRQRLGGVGTHLLDSFKHSVAQGASRVQDLSPLSSLSRGYSIAKNAQGRVVNTVSQVQVGDDLRITLKDGAVDCAVTSINSK